MNKDSFFYIFLKRIEHPSGNPFFELLNRAFNTCLAILGSFIYSGLKKKYPGYTFVLNPACSSGDMVLMKLVYDKLMGISGIDKYIFIVDNADVFRAASELGFKNLYPVSRLKLKALFVYYIFNIDSVTDIINCFSWIMFDYKSSNLYRDNQQSEHPKDGYAEKLFAEKKLVPGKTIILSPYEQTISERKMPRLSSEFWEDLAGKLSSAGYTVCTNCAETSAEPVIKGTTAIYPKLSRVAEVTSYAGNIIAVRSGIVDYARCSDALKVILYPTKSFMDRWSVTRTCDTDKCTELIYEDFTERYGPLTDKVLDIFGVPKE